jgi:hypothetical protein
VGLQETTHHETEASQILGDRILETTAASILGDRIPATAASILGDRIPAIAVSILGDRGHRTIAFALLLIDLEDVARDLPRQILEIDS